MGTTVREFDATALMQFACGFDSLSGEVKGTAVSGTPSPPIGGSETIFSLFKVESIEDFLSALEISASASMQAGFGRGGAKARYFRKVTTHRYSLYIAAVVKVIKGTRILKNPRFDEDAGKKLLTPAGQAAFRKMYGDEFLAGITSGGEFTALLEIRTSNQTEQEEVSAKVHGSDAIGANTGSGSFSSFLQELSSRHSVRIYSLQRGGSDPTPPATPGALIEKALDFPKTVAGEHVYDYLATFQTYDVLERDEGANPIDVKNQRDALEEIGLYLLRYERAVASIEYVLDNPTQFIEPDTAALNAKRNELNKVINTLREGASACFGDYKQCKKPVDLKDPVVQLPERLSGSVQGAIEAAKAAAVEAQGHAIASKGHAARVLEISKTIQPGPNGKSLADEAKLETENAKVAAQLAQDAANKAIVAGSATPLAAEYMAMAKSAAQQAKEAHDLAKSLVGKIHATGYAPYWALPTALLPDHGPTGEGEEEFVWGHIAWRCPAGVDLKEWERSLSDLAIDPSGGAVDVSFVVNSSQVVKDVGSSWICTPTALPGFIYRDYANCFMNRHGEKPGSKYCNQMWGRSLVPEGKIEESRGQSISFDIRLTSTKTALSTEFTLTVYFLQDEADMPRPYLNARLKIIE